MAELRRLESRVGCTGHADEYPKLLAPARQLVEAGDVLVDYSGGTGILARRLLDRIGERETGIVIVDASPKFLRLALEKLGDDPRVAGYRRRMASLLY